MSRTFSLAVLVGLGIGLVNLFWLYAAYYLGLHTSGIAQFQVFMVIWLVINIAMYVAGLRLLKQRNPALGYLGGLAAGSVAAAVSAVIAAVAQIGYFKVVHPAWPEFMAELTRKHSTAAGMSPADVLAKVEQTRASVTLVNYAIESAATALVLGVVLSAIIMAFLRRQRSLPSNTPPSA